MEDDRKVKILRRLEMTSTKDVEPLTLTKTEYQACLVAAKRAYSKGKPPRPPVRPITVGGYKKKKAAAEEIAPPPPSPEGCSKL